MYYHLLTPVDAGGAHLERVLNSYLHSLSLRTLAQVATPMLSAAALAELPEEDIAYMGELLYRLTALNNALHQLAGCLIAVYSELEEFVTDDGADLASFARNKQLEATERTGRTRKRLSTRPTKPQSLLPFQLHTVLAGYFVGAPGGGEKVGTSHSGNFAWTNSLLSNELVHSLRDPGQPATPANLTTHPLAEVLVLELPAEQEDEDERWVGYEVGLSGPEAVAGLEQLLATGQQAAALYHSLAPDDAAGFCQLYQLLRTMLDN